VTITLQPSATAPPAAPRPRRGVRFWLLASVGSLIAVVAIAWTAFAALSVIARQESTAASSYSGIRSVTLDAGPADVTVTAGAGDTVHLAQKLQWSFRHPTTSVSRTGDRLTVRARCPIEVGWSCAVHLTLQVPAETQVDVRSDSGDVDVSGLRTAIAARTGSGDVRVEDVVGNVRARSGDGDVTVENSRAPRVQASSSSGDVSVRLDSSPTEVRATSDDGDVLVLVPDQAGIAYRVDDSSGVSVRIDPSATRQISAHTGSGDVRVGYRA
jgi:hypothetical protein